MIYHGTDFEGLGDLGDVVAAVSAELLSPPTPIDGIVVRGVSGIVVGAPVSIATGIPLVIVRKPSEKSHDYHTVLNLRNVRPPRRLIFLDDFRASGRTELECADALYDETRLWTEPPMYEPRPAITARFFYRDMDWRDDPPSTW